jgi:hypothetical protein
MTVLARLTSATAALVLLAVPARGAASDDHLLVSLDGHAWSHSLDGPLFSPGLRWVPGDSRTARFWVRTGSADPGRLVVTVKGARTGGLMQTGDLAVTARGGGGIWTPVDLPGAHELLNVAPVAAGARVQVAVSVAFKPAATNQSETKSLHLALGVRLEQMPVPGSENAGLPDTGGVSFWWAVAGAGLACIGAAAAVRARRSGAGDD